MKSRMYSVQYIAVEGYCRPSARVLREVVVLKDTLLFPAPHHS